MEINDQFVRFLAGDAFTEDQISEILQFAMQWRQHRAALAQQQGQPLPVDDDTEQRFLQELEHALQRSIDQRA